jgi:hypothetical protein
LDTLCTIEDDFVREKCKWIVTLSDGTRIYQDDDRPGQNERCTWIRLKSYLADSDLSIVRFQIQFFDHIEEVAPPNAQAYYFVQAVDAIACTGERTTYHYYIVGALLDGVIQTYRWMVPEIVCVRTEIREASPDDPKLIINGQRANRKVVL